MVPSSMVGKTSRYWQLACGNNTPSLYYSTQYDNIKITRNGGLVGTIFASGSDYNYSGYNYNSAGIAGSIASVYPSGGVMQLTVQNNNSGISNRYIYSSFSNASYTFQAGDCIEYDVMLSGSIGGTGGIEITNTDQTVFRNSGWYDQNGLSGAPWTDISKYASGIWYHRVLAVPSSMVGKTAQYWQVSGENDIANIVYSSQYDNIAVTRNGGLVGYIFANGTDYNYSGNSFSEGVSSGSLTISNPSGANLQLSTLNDSTSQPYRFVFKSFSNAPYTFQPGDCIEYDVKLSSKVSGAGGLDITNTDGTTFLNHSNWVDQNGISICGDISSIASDVWYHRKLTVPSSMIGKTAQYWQLACANNTPWAYYFAKYDNIAVTRNGVLVGYVFANSPDYNYTGYNYNSAGIQGSSVQLNSSP